MNPIQTESSSKSSTPSKVPTTKQASLTDKAEKSNKKVSRACNTCRLKRKKCDGLDPCYFCTETKVECSYSREPRRRGPPSGYLRYTETRVNLLETLLGLLCISYSSSESIPSTLLTLALTLKSESKTCTQDVWDRYKANWLTSQAAGTIEELTLTFAPFVHNRGEGGASGEGYAKPLLPPTHDGATQAKTEDRSPSPPPPPSLPENSETHVRHTDHSIIPPPSPHSHLAPSSGSISFPVTSNTQTQPSFSAGMLSRESFERTSNARGPSLESASDRPSSVNSHRGLDYEAGQPSSLSLSFPSFPDSSASSSKPVSASYPANHLSRAQLSSKDSQLDMDYFRGSLEGVHPFDSSGESSYTGSYWRTAELALEGILTSNAIENLSQVPTPGPSIMPNWKLQSTPFLPSTPADPVTTNNPTTTNLLETLFPTTSTPSEQVDLPPLHILTHLLDVYYSFIHTTFPVLSDRSSIDNILHNAGSGPASLAGTALGNLGFSSTIKGALKGLGDATTCMLLSMCAYAGRLSPNMDVSALDSSSSFDSIHGSGTGTGGNSKPTAELGVFLGSDPAKIAADLWYEQARGVIHALLRKPPKLETVQALILLALRDYGKGGVVGGGESQAWLLVGMAIRLGQELDLPASASYSPHFTSLNLANTVPIPSTNSRFRGKYTSEEHILRGNLWGIATMLDGFLSLQLGRSPAIAEALKPCAPSSSANHSITSTTSPPSLPHSISYPPPLFAYSYSLFQLVSKIHFWLYLGFGPAISLSSTSLLSSVQQGISLSSSVPSTPGTATPIAMAPSAETETSPPTQAKLATLRVELESWLQALPIQFRVSIGGFGFGGSGVVTKEILEINMFYHVAVILLYRPFVKDRSIQQVTDVFLDAASTFNLLLEKYKNQCASHPAAGAVPLSTSNPHLVYLIFTVALAHLSGYKARLQQARSAPNSHHSQRTPLHHRVASPHERNAPSPAPSSPFPLTPQQQTQQLQTQLHLMNCLDALKAIGKTWELARRCWRTLDQLMDKEGMKMGGMGIGVSATNMSPPPSGLGSSPMMSLQSSSGLGKRKREGEDGGHRPRTSSGQWPGAAGAGAQSRGRAVSLSSAGSESTSPENVSALSLLGDAASTSELSMMGGALTPSDVMQGISASSPSSVRGMTAAESPASGSGLGSGMLNWSATAARGHAQQVDQSTSQSTLIPGSGGLFDDIFFFPGRWLSDFESDSLGDGSTAPGVGGPFDVEPMQAAGGGWGLAMTGMESWDGWGSADWDDKLLWGGRGVASGFDAG